MNFFQRANNGLWVIIFSAVALYACQDDPTPDTPPEEQQPPPSSAEGVKGEFTLAPLEPNDSRPMIPCSGDLCYDVSAPGMKENYNSLIPKLLNMEHSEVFDGSSNSKSLYDTLQDASDAYASCNYFRGINDVIIGDCPDWVTVYGCPGNFFIPEDDLTLHFIRLSSDAGRHYCIASKPEKNTESFLCKNGSVNSGALTTEWTDITSRAPRCIAPSECLKIAENEEHIDEDVCFYGDFSTASTGTIPEQDCDSLAPGTCAINCSCNQNEFAEDTDVDCQFLSEQRPIGLCGYDTCSETSSRSCWIPGTACAVGSWPAWAADAKTTGPMKHAQPGTCVQKTACEEWTDEYPDVLGCGEPLPNNPFE